MRTIDEWARAWGVERLAIDELKSLMGVAAVNLDNSPRFEGTAGSESRQQSLVRIEAADKRVRLFRNNSGAFEDDNGRVVRYGLANESAQVNKVLKSPDLIGWRPKLIEPQHVGMTFGLCTMREIKHEGWVFNPKDQHEAAQFNFLKLAIADGCDAAFASGPGTL